LVHGQELAHGRDEENRQPQRGHAAEDDGIKERLARLTGRQASHDEIDHDGAGHDGAEAARPPGPEHGLGDVRERLGRLLEREHGRRHESLREELSAALERARPVAREEEHDAEHERHRQTHRHRQRGHEDDGHGWGLWCRSGRPKCLLNFWLIFDMDQGRYRC
jgi:hypothetical protein